VFDWLFEGRPAVYVVLASAAVVLLAAWWQTRKRYCLLAVLGVAGLAGLYYLADRLVETDREQVRRKVEEMAGAVQTRKPQQIFRHISDDFRLGGLDKAAFQSFVAANITRINKLVVWDFEFPENAVSDYTAKGRGGPRPTKVMAVEFSVKPVGGIAGDAAFYLCRARFIRDPDGQWRLLDFTLSNPAVNTNQPIEIPGLGQ
jgi:hypothetical protein